MPQQIYKTKDLYLASLLYAKGIFLVDSFPIKSVYWFMFDNPELCQQVQTNFYKRKESVNAKDYVEGIKTLKSIIHS